MVRVSFLFLSRFHLKVARSNSNPTWLAFQSYGVMLQFAAQRQYFEDLFNENGSLPGGLLLPSPCITTKNPFLQWWTTSVVLPLWACSLYLSEEKNKA